MLNDLQILVNRLIEANLTTKRFLKVDANKAAFEKEWQLHLYTSEELANYPRWGICGGEGLVPLEADKPEMVTHLRNTLPQTLEVITPRRQLPHFFFKVTDGEVPNFVLHIPNDEEGAGEVRAKNQYFVAAGTTIEFNDLQTKEPKTGTYKILHDRPIAELSYQKFMDTIKPFLGKNSEQPITKDIMQSGAEKGTRHFYGIKYACRLIGFEQLDDVAALESLKRWNQKCNPPMNEKDLTRMIQNAKKYSNKYEKKFNTKNGKFIEKNLKSEPDMEYALEILNKHIYKCPTDSRELLVYENPIYVPAETQIHSILESEYGNSLKKHFVEEAYAHLQRANYIERKEINNFTNTIPLKNGMFNLVTQTLEEFSPEQIFTFCFDVEYKNDTDCPKWKNFVKQIVSEEDIPLLQEIMGYCLLPAMPYHKIFWFWGTGRNGKDRVIITLQEIIGRGNYSTLLVSEFSEFRRFSECQLYGKTMNVSNEPRLTKYGLDTNIMKKLSGEGWIEAELKGKNKRLGFMNVAKLIILGNRFPKIQDNSKGWWDRCEVVSFPNSFDGEKCVPNIERQWLPEEKSGILNWMLEGLYRLKEKGFSKTKTAEENKAEFMRVSDPFNAWIMDCIVFIPNARLTRQDSFESYKDYCDELGAENDKEGSFYKKMKETPKIKSYRTTNMGKTERGFEGITLKNSETAIEDKKQTKIVSRMSDMSGTYPPTICDENSVQVCTPDIPDIPDTISNNSVGIHCFDCKKPLEHHEVYSFGGKPYCRECRLKIEEQKKEE